ncbi:D-2-hydroxyacid dehydrogenase [Kribbella sandramycini]|uniref:D-2-hydroxyacid dehydrogenase n=1 Tax=Kribbella sandramycini TaxID=60450 RepID=A0A7Y4P0X6_9ACTN|nr:D-2-hydroxyacid dehydrogenase [Kribbella sandramycini]MBB6566218.1 phosphoglycerate dehydrogenase-like enzyme [Kribbella sandramycini]NOL43116.1 D-2-hydroxyacid dehydrogenase [Kribbella sandramycini]
MNVTLVLLQPATPETADWPGRLEAALPGLRVVREVEALPEADAVYGVLPAELLATCRQLRWLQAPQAGPAPEFYYPELVTHQVVVTNMRDTYTDHVAAHTLALVLGMARGLPRYVRAQQSATWAPDWDPGSVLVLGESRVLVVGAGAVGAEIGRLLSEFGARVEGVDPRVTEPPPGFARVRPVDELDDALPDADVVVLTVPHTPATEGLIDAARLRQFKPGALFVNVGRGPTVRLDDLDQALQDGRLRGAALDVFETEPLPADHPLWARPEVLITPHVAGAGPHAEERRFAVLLENARRFLAGEPLINQVDKAQRY